MDLPIKRGKAAWGWCHGEGKNNFILIYF